MDNSTWPGRLSTLTLCWRYSRKGWRGQRISATSTATATVAPTIGLLPMPRKPYIQRHSFMEAPRWDRRFFPLYPYCAELGFCIFAATFLFRLVTLTVMLSYAFALFLVPYNWNSSTVSRKFILPYALGFMLIGVFHFLIQITHSYFFVTKTKKSETTSNGQNTLCFLFFISIYEDIVDILKKSTLFCMDFKHLHFLWCKQVYRSIL